MRREQIVFVYAEDWAGMYVDGELVVEDHSLEPENVLNALGIQSKKVWTDSKWMHERGHLPKKLDEVKRESNG